MLSDIQYACVQAHVTLLAFVLQDDMEKFPFSNEYQDFNLPETLNPLSSDKSSEGTGYRNVRIHQCGYIHNGVQYFL